MVIEDSDSWLETYEDGGILPYGVAPDTVGGALAIGYAAALDTWNNEHHCE
jgi:hypothetical protein